MSKILPFAWSCALGFVLGWVVVPEGVGVCMDAARAIREPAGDRMRMFNYFQAARHYGVPYALEHYGVEPTRERAK